MSAYTIQRRAQEGTLEKPDIVRITFTRMVTAEEFDVFLTRLSLVYEQKRVFLMHFDTRNMNTYNPFLFIKVAKSLAGWINKHREDTINYLPETLVQVEQSSVIPKFLNMLYKLRRPFSRIKTVNSAQAAKDHIVTVMKSGLQPNPNKT